MWKATVQSQRFPAGSWCWWRCDIGMLLIPLLGLSLRSGEVVVSQTHYASPRSKKIPPALTQTPLQLNSFNTFPVLSMYIQQMSGFTEKHWCSEKGSLRRFIQPLISPPACVPSCVHCAKWQECCRLCVQLVMGSLWKPVEPLCVLPYQSWGVPLSGFEGSHLLPSEGKSFPWYRMVSDLRTSYMAAVGEVALLWIHVLSICFWWSSTKPILPSHSTLPGNTYNRVEYGSYWKTWSLIIVF